MTNEVINELRKRFRNRKVLVVGLGLQGGGVGLVKFFCELGAKVTVTDKKTSEELYSSLKEIKNLPVKLSLGGHKKKDFLEADIIFKGPSIPWDLSELKIAEKKGIPIEMEASFFASNCPAKIIGITGTRGKSTTTMMIYHLLKKCNFSVYLGGNIPQISTINLLKKIKENDWVILELSSWALSGFHRKKISPHIAIFTNFYPDHLNYYQSMKDYFFDKQAIYLYQTEKDYFIANWALKNLIKNKKNVIWFSKKDFSYTLKYLSGDHNLENASAVYKLSQILGIEKEKAIKIITNFKGLPYRQEFIAKKNGILFINDSTSTTPVACIKAIETFKDKKIILILGGNSKNLPTDQLFKKLSLVKKIILLKGTFTDKIIKKLKLKFRDKIEDEIYEDLELAVKKAYNFALELKDNNKVILFSPSATSFSMFNNEFHRGNEFNRIVKKIIKN